MAYPTFMDAALQYTSSAGQVNSSTTVGDVSIDLFFSFAFSRRISLVVAIMTSMLVSSHFISIVSRRRSSSSGVLFSPGVCKRDSALAP